MSSSTNPQNNRPIFTKEDLVNIENELTKDGPLIQFRARNGALFTRPNPSRGPGLADVPPGQREARNMIGFGGERALERVTAEGKQDLFSCVFVRKHVFQGPNRSEVDTRVAFEQTVAAWEASPECATHVAALTASTHLAQHTVRRVVAFGLGTLSFDDGRGVYRSYMREHAAALTVARTLAQINRHRGHEVVLMVQDPAYTSVCKSVLARWGIQVVLGFGARGFALVDDETVVIAHHPNFPVREIVADIARPAAMCWKPETAWDRLPAYRRMAAADVDSESTKRMMLEYAPIAFGGRRRVFEDSQWYVRKGP
ncbi:hypothetical protein F4779DRAFT_639268 [Xylariaceae sp. FL0662B]|nr:hypothetical protein F4779DRAFT_639268 [Xylariaceae sp. FL0662B]